MSVKEKPCKLEILPGNVEEVTVKDDIVLHPLVPLDANGTGVLATIVYDLLNLGYTMTEIRARFRFIPSQWTIKAVRAHVKEYGRTVCLRRPGQHPPWVYVQTTAAQGVATLHTATEGA